MEKKGLRVNGVLRTVIHDPEASLASVLRRQLLLTGTKVSCDTGQCGACSVLVDGKLTLGCSTKMARVPEGAAIVTVEGIGQPGAQHHPGVPGCPVTGDGDVTAETDCGGDGSVDQAG